MTRRTTGLAGTFALMCVAHVAAAQGYSRSRLGAVVAAPQGQPVQLSGALVASSRTPIRQRAGYGPRIAIIAAAPQPQAQARGGRDANQRVAPWQTAGPFNARMDPRPVRRFPGQTAPEQMQPTRLHAAPRGLPTTRGNKPRIGLILPSPPAPQSQFLQTVFAPVQDFGFVQVAQFFYTPAVVLTDGRVFANFNGSFEQVLRRCPAFSGTLPPNFTTSACWMIDSYGRYLVVQPR